MTDPDHLRALLAKATPGEWKAGNCDFYVDGDDGDDLVLGCLGRGGGFRSHEYGVVRGHKPEGQANLALIVAAVNALGPHLDAMEAKDAEIARLREALRPYADIVEHDISIRESDEDMYIPMRDYNRARSITIGDMRAASAAFDGIPQ